MDETVIHTVRNLLYLGKEQHEKYYKDVIVECSHSIHEPIKKISLSLFRSPVRKPKTKQAEKISLLKNDVALFSHLYVVMQQRDSDMTTFFSHENHPYPPSISDGGKLRFGKKSDLLNILASYTDADPPDALDVKLLDGACVVHYLSTAGTATFDSYADDVFIPHILKQLENCNRIDIVWDTYMPQSIKESTREKRGKELWRRVEGKAKLPRNWADFLRDPANKEELFSYLTGKVTTVSCPEGKEIVATNGTKSVFLGSDRSMDECDHEEADTRLLVH